MARRKSVRHGDQFYGCPQWPAIIRLQVLYLKNENLQLQNKLLLEENKMLKRQIRGKESMWKQPFVFTLFFVIAIWMYMLK
ncbi:hypothetical protein Hanom_Chr04g00328931 [Helianthus anomalus]